jgi:hypothetical protein
VVGSDNVSVIGGTAAFASKNAGNGKTVTATGLSLSGTAAGNYQLASTGAITTANITARALTISATGVNKTYDGTPNATVTLSDDRLSGDNLTTSYTTAFFANKNVGSGKTVSVSGFSVSGADAANYTASTTATTTADISAKGLTVSGVTADNKAYDGTTAATLSTNAVAFAGVIGAEIVDLVTNGYTATFASPDIGTNIAVTVSGLTVGGPDATNYTLAQPTELTANITASALTVTGITANDKAYDGTTTATLNLSGATLNGVASGDAVTLNIANAAGAFADGNVGTGKTVTVSGLALAGPDAGNYTLTQPTTTANITTVPLSVAGVTANNKVYDGTTVATLNVASAALVGVVSGDAVMLNTASATGVFANANVGTAKPVSLTGLALSGAKAANYTLTQPVTTADITTATLTASITAGNKTYDGSTAATIVTSSLSGVLGNEDVSLTAGTAAFGDKRVGNGKTVTATGLSLSGTAAGNYQLATTGAITTANITARSLTISATGVNKVYDGTTAATVILTDDRIADDVLTTSYTAATFADANAASGKTVNVSGITVIGTDSGNYIFSSTATTTADITPAGTANLVTSSANPSPAGASIIFTASLTAVTPGAGTPTGTVQFRTNGIAAGEPVTLSNGVASFSTALLSPGTNSISAEYAGDVNFTGSTSTLTPPQVVTEPLFGILVGTLKNQSVAVRAEKLVATDVPVTLAGVSANSTNGGIVTLSNGLVTYTPVTNFVGADLFTYVVNDGSNSATGSVQVIVVDTGALAPNSLGAVVVGTDGAHARFAGIPGSTYIIERSTDGADWSAVGTAVVPASGLFEFLDSAPPSGSVFYRTTVQ